MLKTFPKSLNHRGHGGTQRNATEEFIGGTKGFLRDFMAGVAVEHAQFGVRANCVCPGP